MDKFMLNWLKKAAPADAAGAESRATRPAEVAAPAQGSAVSVLDSARGKASSKSAVPKKAVGAKAAKATDNKEPKEPRKAPAPRARAKKPRKRAASESADEETGEADVDGASGAATGAGMDGKSNGEDASAASSSRAGIKGSSTCVNSASTANDVPAQNAEAESEAGDSGSDSSEDRNDYEAIRMKNIAANNQMMLQLGLLDCRPPEPAAPPRPKPKKARPVPRREVVPIERRSSARLAGKESTATAIAEAVKADIAPEEIAEEDASQYTAWTSFSSVPVTALVEDLLAKFDAHLYGGHRHNIYAMSLDPASSTLAVGGKGGLLSFFAADSAPSREADGATAPALSVKVHARWVSEVQFTGLRSDAGPLILSTADDGALILSKLSLADEPTVTASARLDPVVKVKSIHSGGIFAMDERRGEIVTCSKDASVGWSRLRPDGIDVVKVLPDMGGGVLKCVRWRDPGREFVCCGNDACVTGYDVNANSSTFVLKDAHASPVNSVDIDADDSWRIITAGFDRTLKLWDTRSPGAPVAVMKSHHGAGRDKASLTRPIFFAGGILTIGDNTPNLYIYSKTSGALESTVNVGFTASSLLAGPTGGLYAAHGTNAVWQFARLRTGQ
eukprot:m.88925 g.88925  ORF g.88925 m.88925 type:complete len:618 (+) comp8388_c0_seq1:859-2712(+)